MKRRGAWYSEEWSPSVPDAPSQLRLQAGRRVQGLMSGRGQDCSGKEVAGLFGNSCASWPTSFSEDAILPYFLEFYVCILVINVLVISVDSSLV